MSKLIENTYTLGKGRVYFDSPIDRAREELHTIRQYRDAELNREILTKKFGQFSLQMYLTGKAGRELKRYVKRLYAEDRHHRPKMPGGLGNAVTMKYVGPSVNLRGQRALVYIDHNRAYAQFDNMDLKYASGWWPFSANSFAFVPDTWADLVASDVRGETDYGL